MATPNRAWLRTALSSALLLLGLAVGTTVLLALIDAASREQVERNEQAWILQRLQSALAGQAHDNDLLTDRITVTAPDLLGTARPVRIYRVRQHGQPRAVVIQTFAAGYRGPIELLVGIAEDCTLIAVNVIRHQENTGLGDAFERDPGWLRAFGGRSLLSPPQQRWSVRQDGGDFDTFTGATITPRGIVGAVRRALEYYRANGEQLFEQ